jgi:hypothetical protein|tara:strand:+ start:178 stop:516 length:339 start_codon:yes stop_codon:yes gene_type:complete
MPKNSRRIASKQAELGQRKRRSKKGPLDTTQESTNTPEIQNIIKEAKSELSQSYNSTHIEKNPSNPKTIITDSKNNHEVGNINPHIWPEIKRILLVTTLVFAVMGGVFAVMS